MDKPIRESKANNNLIKNLSSSTFIRTLALVSKVQLLFKNERIFETNVWQCGVDVTGRGPPEVLAFLAMLYLVIWII